MNPETLLSVLAALAGFVLKTTFAFGTCWVVSLLVPSPNGKFMTWLAFLAGVAGYWLWLVQNVLMSGVRGFVEVTPALPFPSYGKAWHLPVSWAGPLSLGLRAIGTAYLFILGYFLVAYIKKQLHLRWVLRLSYPPPVEILKTFESVARNTAFGHINLRVLSGISSPATFGWIRPMILLPISCVEQNGSEVEQNGSELENILRHELHHIRRLDFVSNALAASCRALLFFHPAAWYAMKKLRLQRELACDLAVVSNSPEKRATYAECLVHFARLNLSAGTPPWDLDFVSSAHLKIRVRSVLNGPRRLPGWKVSLRAAFGAILFAAFLGSAPSLAILFSYTHPQWSQQAPSVAAPPVLKERRTHVARQDRPSPPTLAAAPDPILINREPEAVQLVPRAPETLMRQLAKTTTSRLGGGSGDAVSESEPSANVSTTGWPPGRPRSSATQMKSVTSIIAGAATGIGQIGDHDHGKDK